MNAALKSISFRGKKADYFMMENLSPRFSKIDAYQVVWNGHYINYFETARMEMCRHCGFDTESLSELGYFLPVYSYQVDIFEPLLAKDLFSVGVRPVSLQPGVFTFMHVIVKNERVVATSKLKHVLIDKVTKSVVTLEDRNLQLSFSKFHDLFGA